MMAPAESITTCELKMASPSFSETPLMIASESVRAISCSSGTAPSLQGRCLLADDLHGVAGVGHFRKDDQLCARGFRAFGEVAQLASVRGEIAKRAGDLCGGDFHDDLQFR